MRHYADQVVVITGAAGGMGAALARRFAQSYARLALLDLDGEAAEKLALGLRVQGHDARAFACDVSDEESCQKALEKVAREMGPVEVLINNAGITHRSAFAQTQAQVHRRVMGVNYFGSLYCTQTVLPSLLEHKGQIIVVSSIAGFSPLLGRTGYAASKHALHGLFGSLRAELAGSGVSVLLVCPGFTDTPICTSALGGDGGITDHPQSTLGKVAQPEDVAQAVFGAARKDRRLLVLSAVGKLTRAMMRLAPGLYETLMARFMAKELER